MVPRSAFLEKNEIESILDSALVLLNDVGVKFFSDEALRILKKGGADVDFQSKTVKMPTSLVEEAVRKAPKAVKLYDRDGKSYVSLEGDNVHFCPGAAAIKYMDPETGEVREPVLKDIKDFVKVVDALEHVAINTASLVPRDIPYEIADRWRVYMWLRYSSKPAVVGAFTIDGLNDIVDLLSLVVGGKKELMEKPRCYMAATASPPLKWSEVIAQNIIDAARAGIPLHSASMANPGASAPITLAGTLVVHAAEVLSGLVLAQMARAGAPVLWGASATIFDLKCAAGSTGAIEVAMQSGALAQIAKHLNLPLSMWLGISDSKVVDYQASMESSMGFLLGALSGVNVIAGPGMLEFESCQSLEKLVLDNEICGMILRMLKGIEVSDESLAVDLVKRVGPGGDLTKDVEALRFTQKWFRNEQYLPTQVTSRETRSVWQNKGSKDAFQRARERVKETLAKHETKQLPNDIEKELQKILHRAAEKHKVKSPKLP